MMVVFVMQLCYLLLSVLNCLLVVSSHSLGAAPHAVFANTGDNVSISCNARVPFMSADWVRSLYGETEEKEICLNTGICPNGYAKRLSVDTTKNFTLTIRNVTVNDTGEYTCVAYDDFTYNRYSTRLNVSNRLVNADKATTASYSTSLTTSVTKQHESDEDRTVTLIVVSIITVTLALLLVIIICVVVASKKATGKYTGTSRCTTTTCTWLSIKQSAGKNSDAAVGNNRSNYDNNGAHADALDNLSVVTDGSTILKLDNSDLSTYIKDVKDIDADSLKVLLADEKNKSPADDSVSEQRSSDQAKSDEAKTIAFMSVDQESRLFLITILNLFRQFYNGDNDIAAAAKSFELLASTSALWWNKLTEKNAAKRRVRRLLYYECSGYSGTPVHLKPLRLSSTISPTVGVAVLDGKVYAVCKQSNKVSACTSTQGDIVVDGMKSPADMVACKSDQSLYIADDTERCIWRVPIIGKAERWNEMKKLVPKALSLKNRELLVTTSSNVIVKIGRGGKQLARIDLQDLHPLHAVQTASNTFMVCSKLARGSQVVEVDRDGKELNRFVCVLPMLRLPSYLVLDQDGRLLVADSSNNRIMLLDAKLKHGCAILNQQRDGIVEPRRLCLDDCTGQLFVTQCDSNKYCVQVFDIKRSQRDKQRACSA